MGEWGKEATFALACCDPNVFPINCAFDCSNRDVSVRTNGELLTRMVSEVDFPVLQAAITTEKGVTRISIDWDEEKPEPGHLEGFSSDGMHFRGYFGYSAKDEKCEFQLTLFSNKNDRILFVIRKLLRPRRRRNLVVQT